jgi:hypothetical protein
VTAFTGRDYNKMRHAIDRLGYTMMGIHSDQAYTNDDLALMFVPPYMLDALRLVYQIETDSNASGKLYLDLTKVMPMETTNLLDDEVECYCTSAVLQFEFDREKTPGGFITPRPVFGSVYEPMALFKGAQGHYVGEIRSRLLDQMAELLRVSAHWSAVYWMFDQLQDSMRTPQQMRYVWPATYALATTAKLDMAASLSSASTRAAGNAVIPVHVSDFLKPTYEIVSNAALMQGPNEEHIKRWREGPMTLHNLKFKMRARSDRPWTEFHGH